MRFPSWLRPWRQTRRTVAGCVLRPDGMDWVVLAGSSMAPDTLCCAEQLDIPADLQAGVTAAWDGQAFGQWLRAFLRGQDHSIDGICMSVNDAWVSTYTIGLPQVLNGDDLHFQLMAELEALHLPGLSQMCVAYARVDVASTQEPPSAVQRYRVGVVAQAHVQVLEQMARTAGVPVWAIEPHADAVQRTQQNDLLAALPAASVAVGLQCDAAFGLALGSWADAGLRFSPSRAQQALQTRRAWWARTAAAASAGALLACVGVSGWAAWLQPPTDGVDVAASQRALDAAKQQELALRTQVQQTQALTQWWHAQTALQHQTAQWGRVLAQQAHGVWVSEVQQHEGHWVVQGEALSSAHVHQLLQALTAVDIWTRAPRAQRLQLSHGASTRMASTWQFRIEADLKVSG